MAHIYDLIDVWNNPSTTFNAIKMNVTDTASASGSLLLDLQVGGVSQFKVDKSGTGTFAGTVYTSKISNGINTLSIGSDGGNAPLLFLHNNSGVMQLNSSTELILNSGMRFMWTDGNIYGTKDLYLIRANTATLQLGDNDVAGSPVAQTLQVQSAKNVSNTAGANFTINGSRGTGTGAGGSIIFRVSPAGSSGTGQNALVNSLQLLSNGWIKFLNDSTNNTFVMKPATQGCILGREDGNNDNLFLSVGTAAGVGVVLNSSTNKAFGFSTDSSFATVDTLITRGGAGTLQLGAADVANFPQAQVLRVQSASGVANAAGANFTIQGSAGTGTGAGGSIIFQVAPAGSSSSTKNPYSTALTINANRQIVINDAGTTADSASLPGLVFGSTGFIRFLTGGSWAGFGFGYSGTSFPSIIVGHAGTNMLLPSHGSYTWSSVTNTPYGTVDLILARDAANTLAQRNGTSPQTFNIYNTYTDVSNYERGVMRWSGNVLQIGGEAAGTGTNRNVQILAGGYPYIVISPVAGTVNINSNIFAGSGEIQSGSSIIVNTTYGIGIQFSGRSTINSPVDGNIALYNNARTDFGRLQFGGTTSAFPALKRSGTTIQARLADDSGDAALQCGTQTAGATAFNVVGTGNTSIASITNVSNGTLLQVLSSNSDPLMTVNDTTSGTIFSVQSNTAATLFQVNDTTSGTLLAVTNNTGADVFTVSDGGAVNVAGSTVTSNTVPLVNLSQTWNNAGQNFTAIKLNVANTNSGSASYLMDLQVGGTSKFSVRKDGEASFGGNIYVAGGTAVRPLSSGSGGTNFSILANHLGLSAIFEGYNGQQTLGLGGPSNTYPGAHVPLASYFGFYDFNNTAPDTKLYRDAAGTLALRNGVNPQLFRVYSTYTDASTNAFGGIGAGVNLNGTTGDSNTLYIGSQKTGAPTALTKLAIQVDGTTRLDYNITNGSSWSTSAKIISSDSLFGGYVVVDAAAGNFKGFYLAYTGGGGARINSVADSTLLLTNYVNNDFNRLMFGGSTSAFPALKRISSGNAIQVIAADNANSAGFIVGNQQLSNTATDGFLYVPTCDGTPTGTPTTQANTVPIVVDTTNHKLYFYSGGAWRDAGP